MQPKIVKQRKIIFNFDLNFTKGIHHFKIPLHLVILELSNNNSTASICTFTSRFLVIYIELQILNLIAFSSSADLLNVYILEYISLYYEWLPFYFLLYIAARTLY